MRTTIVATVLFACLFSFTTPVAAGNIGIGVIIGEPTGICALKKISDSNSLDAALAWSLADNNSLHLHADYLFHRTGLLPVPCYYGIGGRVKLVEDNGNDDNKKESHIGIRFPLGITYLFVPHPVDAFFEIVPIFDLLPGTGFDLNAAVGVRYYF